MRKPEFDPSPLRLLVLSLFVLCSGLGGCGGGDEPEGPFDGDAAVAPPSGGAGGSPEQPSEPGPAGAGGAVPSDDAGPPVEPPLDGGPPVTEGDGGARPDASSPDAGPDAGPDPDPPAPVFAPPPLDPTVPTNTYSATRFLYTGDNPPQQGVHPDTIVPRRAAVIRGQVTDGDGAALEGVRVSVLHHPEYGFTRTREAGQFDLAVNGGGPLTVVYELAEHLPAQRRVHVPWQDYVWAPDVALITLDDAVTVIDLTSGAPQKHRGSAVTDEDGERQATLLFPSGTTAEAVLPDGSRQPLEQLSVRATEYTVGPNGPQRMPGELPANSGYTYAVELSVDEAMGMGAKSVEFAEPVTFYLDNFLEFPVGGAVPTGYYDPEEARWVASEDGRIVEIVAIEGGAAALDLDGDGEADGAAALAELGVTAAELAELAELYEVGKTLWRVPVAHFSAWDCNWPFGPPEGALVPNVVPFGGAGFGSGGGRRPYDRWPADFDCSRPGSVIGCQSQNLADSVPISGTTFELHYNSRNQAARRDAYALTLPLIEGPPPSGVERVVLEITVAGRRFETAFEAAADLSYEFVWDGEDVHGRRYEGLAPVTVRIGHEYQGEYQEPGSGTGASFGAWGGVPITGNRTRETVTLWQVWEGSLGVLSPLGHGLAGWSLSPHHVYQASGGALQRGDGARQEVTGGPTLDTIAGTGARCTPSVSDYPACGNDGDALAAQVDSPWSVAAGPDGSVYFSEYNHPRIRRIDQAGTVHAFAGSMEQGYAGDGGPALEARLEHVESLAVGPDGSVFMLDSCRVRKVGPDGIIETIAGGAECGYTGDDGPAADAQLAQITRSNPGDIALSAEGDLYISDSGNNRIRRVDARGVITTVAGTGDTCGLPPASCGDGGPATEARITGGAIATAPDGSLYIQHRNTTNRAYVRRIAPSGIIDTVAGGTCNPELGSCGDGGPAIEAGLRLFTDLAVDRAGAVYIYERGVQPPAGTGIWPRIRQIGTDGNIRPVAGADSNEVHSEDGTLAMAARLRGAKMALGPQGEVYLPFMYVTPPTGTPTHDRVRALRSALPAFGGLTSVVPSEDGAEIYVFEFDGRHQRTIDALTGEVRFVFDYDASGRLASITDGDENVTSIEWGSGGEPQAIVATTGQRTELTVDADGYVASITGPAGLLRSLETTEGGLLTQRTDGRGEVSRYTYDDLGRLTAAEDPTGATQTLSHALLADGFEVVHTSAAGRETRYAAHYAPTNDWQVVTEHPDGSQIVSQMLPDGVRVTTFPDGTEDILEIGPDPRFGMAAPLPVWRHVQTPGGRELVYQMARQVELEDPRDVLSLTTLVDTLSINGATTTLAYDAATGSFSETSAEGRSQTWLLDGQRRTLEHRADGLVDVAYTYDAQGRLQSMIEDPGGANLVTSVTHDAGGFPSGGTDPLGRPWVITRDAAGRVTSAAHPGSFSHDAQHDGAGNVTALTPPGQPPHLLAYTPTSLLSAYTPPEVTGQATAVTYAYDADRQLTGVAFADGSGLSVAYDAAGRLESFTAETGTTTVERDAAGRVTRVVHPRGVTLDEVWDAQRVVERLWSGPFAASVQTDYDGRSRLMAVAVNGTDEIGLAYDGDGLLTGAGALAVTRSPLHGLVTATALGQVQTAQDHDGFGDLASLSAAHDGSDILGFLYTRDAVGRIAELVEDRGGDATTLAFEYDSAGRLAQVLADGALREAYDYDANGNRLTADYGDGALSATYDAQDRLVAYGGVTYSYTSGGHLAERVDGSDVTSYYYDELGNLNAVTLPDGTEIDYLVDGMGRRVARRVDGSLERGWVYKDDLNPIAELDDAGSVTSRFVYGTREHVPDYMIRDGQTYRIVVDHLGSVRRVVNAATGAVVQALDYDAFGRVLEDTNPGFQPFAFAGGHYDPDTGLVRFGARDYDPEVGRWTSKDPMGFGAGSTNLYTYVGNDPVDRIDPTGLFYDPGKKGRRVGDQGCRMICGRHRDICDALSAGGAGGFDYDGCVEDCSGRIDDAISDIELAFLPGMLPGLFQTGGNMLKAGQRLLAGRGR